MSEGTRLLVEVVPRVPDMVPTRQNGEPTYASKLEVAEFRIDPALPAEHLGRVVRAGSPRPGAWFEVGGGRVKVPRARVVPDGPGAGEVVRSGDGALLGTRSGALLLLEVQPEGRRPMSGAAWLAGRRGPTVLDPLVGGAGA
ncbi:MAG: hypothetical protein M5T61_10710 [Acidimicrobiia bacterium]|nr:hypothetical protein [Acidimicrobiia bacterium]